MQKKTLDYTIVPITEDDIESFWLALGSVARERQYLIWGRVIILQACKNKLLKEFNYNQIEQRTNM